MGEERALCVSRAADEVCDVEMTNGAINIHCTQHCSLCIPSVCWAEKGGQREGERTGGEKERDRVGEAQGETRESANPLTLRS